MFYERKNFRLIFQSINQTGINHNDQSINHDQSGINKTDKLEINPSDQSIN